MLVRAGYEVREANCCEAAIACLRERQPDLVLLDLAMPGKDGFETFRELRSISHDVPIMFLTSTVTEEFEVKCFNLGAEDFMDKGRSDVTLLARISRVLNRSCATDAGAGGDEQGMFRIGKTAVDLEQRCLIREDGTRLNLSRVDKDILTVLNARRGRYVTCGEMVELSRGKDYRLAPGTVRAEICRLKAKLGDDASQIKSERRSGYCLL